jgi:hypothetical protein
LSSSCCLVIHHLKFFGPRIISFLSPFSPLKYGALWILSLDTRKYRHKSRYTT